MNNPNQAPQSPNGPEAEILRYSDGFVAERYSRPGDTVALEGSLRSGKKMHGRVGLASPLASPAESLAVGMAVITTASGKKLGLTAGLAIDMDRFEFEEPSLKKSYEITIGERGDDGLPFIEHDEIEQVVLRDQKQEDNRQDVTAVDSPSDFHVLEEMAQHIMAHNELPRRAEAAERFRKIAKAGGIDPGAL